MAGWLGSRDLGFSDRDPLKRAGNFVACVTSASLRFRSKERGTRVKDRAKNGASKRAGRGGEERLSFHFSRSQNRKSRSSFFFFCSETKRKRLLRRLEILPHENFSPVTGINAGLILAVRMASSCIACCILHIMSIPFN